jgi:cyclopropane fatty-acyl-phospholipid synthase-like methyltransferase
MLMDFLTLALILIAVVLVFMAWSQVFGAPWIPTSHKTIRKMLELARLKPGETLYDLGCGDGRIIIDAAQDFGANAIGIEIDPIRYFWAKLLILQFRLQCNAKVILGNFFKSNLSKADVVTLYLLQETNVKLMKKLSDELKPGARIVTNTFTLPGWKAVRQDDNSKIYVYEVRK